MIEIIIKAINNFLFVSNTAKITAKTITLKPDIFIAPYIDVQINPCGYKIL